MGELETTPENQLVIKKQHGGKRPGAGQPPKTEKYKRQIAKATDVMGKMLPDAADAVTDLATGAYQLLVLDTRNGEWIKPANDRIAAQAVDMRIFRVYRTLPDVKAIQIVFERIMGKVAQPVDVRVQQVVSEVLEAQSLLMRVIEEHVPAEYLPQIRAELERVAAHHSTARNAISSIS